jgi:copper transport protein
VAGAELLELPREVRLVFSEAVALALTRIELVGPDGLVVALLSPVQLPDSPQVVVANIEGALVAGAYQLVWRTAGKDGHPVQGQFGFAIAEAAFGAGGTGGEGGTRGLQGGRDGVAPGGTPVGGSDGSGNAWGASPGSAAQEPGLVAPSGRDQGGADVLQRFGVESPLYASIRLLLFLGVLGVVGVTSFRLVVMTRVARRERAAGQLLAESIGVAPARLGLGLVWLLGIAVALRLVAQGYALGGGIFDGAGLRVLLSGTSWGWGWFAQVLATVMAGLGFYWASRGRVGGWAVSGGAVLLLVFTPGLSGHAAGVSPGTSLALLADAGHLLGAGGWLGSLLVLLGVGIPAALRLGGAARGRSVAALVQAFSGWALLCASLVVVTGGIGAWLHIGSLPALWQSGYGRALLVKIGVLSLVFGAGAYNYLRIRPVVGSDGGARRLRISSTVELAIGVAVLAVTAVLVALPTPRLDLTGGAATVAGVDGPAPEASR